MLRYISTYIKASEFKGKNKIFPFFTLPGLSQREQLGRKRRPCNRRWLNQMEFSRQWEAVQTGWLCSLQLRAARCEWSGAQKPNITNLPCPSKFPCPALMQQRHMEPVLTTAQKCQHILFLGQTKSRNEKENEKNENVTAAQSVSHCWLMY